MLKFIKSRWRKVGNSLGNTPRYFQKSPTNLAQKAALVPLLSKYASGTLLDVGAGRQIYRRFLPDGITYRAMDYGETEGEYQKDRQLDLVGDAQNIPLEDSTVDTVLCSEVLEHLPRPHEAAKEILRLLKPGGHAIITVPFLGYYHDEPWDFFRFTKHGLKSLFEGENSEIIHQQGVGGLFTYIGYIRSTIILSLCYGIPVLWHIVFYSNLLLSHIDLALDSLTKTASLMPSTNIIVVKKRA